MIYALISTFLSSIGTIYWKKALNYDVNTHIFSILAYSSFFVITPILYIFWYLDFSIINLNHISIILLIIIANFFSRIFSQKSYTIDKISTLTPYENINKIISIFLWFMIFWNMSYLSLIMTILATLTIVFFSIDYKNINKPKSIKLFLVYQILTSINILITAYLLKFITEWDFYVLNHMLWILFMFIIILITWNHKNVKTINKSFYWNRILASIFWWISWLIWIIIIKQLWVAISVLLSFLWVWVTLILSYFILKDTPSYKNILMTILVSLFVWLWYYYK